MGEAKKGIVNADIVPRACHVAATDDLESAARKGGLGADAWKGRVDDPPLKGVFERFLVSGAPWEERGSMTWHAGMDAEPPILFP
jgi:hypothetical protein